MTFPTKKTLTKPPCLIYCYEERGTEEYESELDDDDKSCLRKGDIEGASHLIVTSCRNVEGRRSQTRLYCEQLIRIARVSIN